MTSTAEGKDEDGGREWLLETLANCLAVLRDAEVLNLDDIEEEEEGPAD